ncbi:protoheme IX farnesyltransferase, mitochondrial-like [Clavelina lepadiformis]|uniref:protoheme IX farnesyltransferase, mitochondrial-like n=1 Tax=Clavelina lepadiformis TaxID=159417 RepID=UPI00404134BD
MLCLNAHGNILKTWQYCQRVKVLLIPSSYNGVKSLLTTQGFKLSSQPAKFYEKKSYTSVKLFESPRLSGHQILSFKNELSTLTDSAKIPLTKLPSIYAALSKWYLTLFVVMTMDAGYCLAPVAFDQSAFYIATVGTLLCSCCANTLNQIAEVEYDALMDRTRRRPLVRNLITPNHAFGFSVISGAAGFSILYGGVNLLTASLGLSTILLYATVYTPLKRVHWFNTWVGAVVGAIPPVMGWTAATGQISAGAFIFSGILYAWQFPHFYALAWRRRNDYARGNYQMLPLSHPQATKYVVVVHALSLWALCFAAPPTAVASWAFTWLSVPLNFWLTKDSFNFYREGNSRAAKKLYKCSLYYIVLLSAGLIVDRKVLSKLNMNEHKDKIFEILSKTAPKETLF